MAVRMKCLGIWTRLREDLLCYGFPYDAHPPCSSPIPLSYLHSPFLFPVSIILSCLPSPFYFPVSSIPLPSPLLSSFSSTLLSSFSPFSSSLLSPFSPFPSIYLSIYLSMPVIRYDYCSFSLTCSM